MEVTLSKFSQKNLPAIHNFYTNCIEWKLWDAPCEDWSYNENYELSKRLERTNHTPCFEYEIFYDEEHIGWVSDYYMTNDYKWNDLEKTDKIAIGIVIPEQKYRHLGIGKQVYKEYLSYFKSLGYKEIYTQTWSGNIPMINLAKSLGFEEVNRFKDLRTVRDRKYDALTFKIIL